MRIGIIGIGVFVFTVCIVSTTVAETRIDEAVRLSKLALSAMECSMLAPDKADARRLAKIGLTSGKEYFDAVAKLSDEEQKIAGRNISATWKGVTGISPDFVLGRIWQKMEDTIQESLGSDKRKWAHEKAKKYAEKNCVGVR